MVVAHATTMIITWKFLICTPLIDCFTRWNHPWPRFSIRNPKNTKVIKNHGSNETWKSMSSKRIVYQWKWWHFTYWMLVVKVQENHKSPFIIYAILKVLILYAFYILYSGNFLNFFSLSCSVIRKIYFFKM